jgi:hypothetical protein
LNGLGNLEGHWLEKVRIRTEAETNDGKSTTHRTSSVPVKEISTR